MCFNLRALSRFFSFISIDTSKVTKSGSPHHSRSKELQMFFWEGDVYEGRVNPFIIILLCVEKLVCYQFSFAEVDCYQMKGPGEKRHVAKSRFWEKGL